MFKRQKKGATSGSRGKRPATDEGNSDPLSISFRNNDQKSRYDVLSKRKILGTRYIDNYTLETLGIKDDIYWMINNLGWGDLMSINYPTYPRITLEFLSSIEANIIQGEGCEQGKITFRLFNVDYTWTLEDFNLTYNLPCGGERGFPRAFTDYEFWREIASTNERYNPSKSKSSALQNPVFRYLHRIMANTIFGRGDSEGVVRQSELLMMWAMIQGVNVDSGSYFIRHLLKIGKSSAGTIMVGGLITRIAIAIGCDLSGLETIKSSQRIDLDALMAMKMIVREEGKYCLRLKDRFPLHLPNPQRTTIHDRSNWLMTDIMPLPDIRRSPSPVQPRAEPSRHSFAFGDHFAGSSTFNFTDFRSSIDAIRTEQAEQRRLIEEQRQRTERYMERAENFFAQAETYFKDEDTHRRREEDQWERDADHRSRMNLTAGQMMHIYDWHTHLGNVPRLPHFPPPPLRSPSPPPPPPPSF